MPGFAACGTRYNPQHMTAPYEIRTRDNCLEGSGVTTTLMVHKAGLREDDVYPAIQCTFGPLHIRTQPFIYTPIFGFGVWTHYICWHRALLACNGRCPRRAYTPLSVNIILIFGCSYQISRAFHCWSAE